MKIVIFFFVILKCRSPIFQEIDKFKTHVDNTV